MKNNITVTVTGASGNIGYALLFRIASGQLFGPETVVNLNLFDITPALPAVRGVVMELEDCAFPLLGNITVTDDMAVAATDANWVICVGAIPRKKGMERGDLLQLNGGIFTGIGQAVDAKAAEDVKVFVVGNPCNTNALIAMHSAPNVPNDRFYAMTKLDENRARAQLALRLACRIEDIHGLYIWGNHSATQYPDYHHAHCVDQPVMDLIADSHWLNDTFIPTVQKRGAAIIEARGASSAASAANAIIDGIRDLHFDTPVGQGYSACAVSNGEYGVDAGLIFSFPMRTVNGVPTIIQDIAHNAFSQEKLAVTLQELRQERDAVQALGLID